MKILLNDVEVSVVDSSFSFKESIGESDLSFDIDISENDNSEFSLLKGTRVVLKDKNDNDLYKGFIYESNESEYSDYGEKRVSVDCISDKWVLQNTYISGEVENKNLGVFLKEIIEDTGTGFLVGTVYNSSRNIPFLEFENLKVSDVLDKLCDMFDCYYVVKSNGRVEFLKLGTKSGGDINSSDVLGDITKTNKNDGYANRIVLNNYYIKRVKIEYKIGDGTEKVFTLSHPIEKVIRAKYSYFDENLNKVVNVDISSDEIKERGEVGSDGGNIKINYTRGNDTIEWVDSNYVLENKDTLEVEYEGLVKIKKMKNDVIEQNRFLNLNGVLSVVPYHVDDIVMGEQNAEELMSLLLEKKKMDAVVLQFETYKKLEVGVTYRCRFDDIGIDDNFIVNDIEYINEISDFRYVVNVSKGNFDDDWSRYFSDIEIKSSKNGGLGSASGNGYQEVDVNLSMIETRNNRPTDVQQGRIWLLVDN